MELVTRIIFNISGATIANYLFRSDFKILSTVEFKGDIKFRDDSIEKTSRCRLINYCFF